MAEYSPMMQHYIATKNEYKDCILFYRLGDFYEMFFEDALIASKRIGNHPDGGRIADLRSGLRCVECRSMRWMDT